MADFSSPEWYLPWLASFGGPESGVWKDGYGNAVPYVIRERALGPVRIRTLSCACNDHTPRFDIDARTVPDATLFPQMLSELGCQLIEMHYLEPDARALAASQDIPKHQILIEACEDSPRVDTSSLSWEEYWAGLGKARSTWARKERRLIDRSGFSFLVYDKWSEIEAHWEEMLALEAAGWKGKMGTAIGQSEETRGFYREMLRNFAGSGQARIFTLHSPEGRLVAFQMCLLIKGVIYQLKVAYDEQLRKESPGQVLQLQILRWCHSTPDILAFDFLGGGGKAYQNKLWWSTERIPLKSLYVFSRSPAGLAAMSRLKFLPRIKRRIVAMLPSQSRRKTPE